MNSLDLLLRSHLNEYRLPILSKDTWKQLNEKYSKEEIKSAIIRCIIDNDSIFPFRDISHDKMETAFRRLLHTNVDQFIIQDGDVIEKFPDYSFPYRQYGLFTIQLGHQYNDISNFFMQEERYRCAGYNIDAPLSIWKNKTKLEKLNWTLWRMNNDKLSMSTYRGTFRLGSYVATQFKPHVAKTIYHAARARKIMDMSCGWGDRLAAFYTSPAATTYVGCDPSDRTFDVYKRMCIAYETLLTGNPPVVLESDDFFECQGTKNVRIYRSPSESVSLVGVENDFDCIFTSPPYFSTERYNEGGVHENEQSWKKYNNYQEWRDNYLFPSLKKFSSKLGPEGVVLINIIDPVINGIRYRICDEMTQHLISEGLFFMGQIGMRIKQRPKKTAELPKFMGKHYIENIWCFSKKQSSKFSINSFKLSELFT